MSQEIRETPAGMRTTMEREWPALADFVRDLYRRGCRTLYVVGSGASYNASLAPVLLTRGQKEISYLPMLASDFLVYTPALEPTDVVLIVSVSGRNKDVLEVAKLLPPSQAVALINDEGSPLEKLVGRAFRMYAGPQKTIAASKTVTVTMTALYMLAIELLAGSEREGQAGALREELLKMPEVVERTIAAALPAMERIAQRIFHHTAYYIVATGPNLATAREAALKFKEAAAVHAEGYPARDLIHGPIYGITNTAPIIELAARGRGYQEVDQTGRIFLAVGAPVVKITNVPADPAPYVGYFALPYEGGEELAPLAFLPAVQLLAYQIALMRGVDIDNPPFYEIVHQALRVDD